MEKNFDVWNNRKKSLEKFAHGQLAFHEREVWWCSLGLNLGDEQDGKNEFFFNDKVAWVLPLTTLSQIRLVSVKRFRRKFVNLLSYLFRGSIQVT